MYRRRFYRRRRAFGKRRFYRRRTSNYARRGRITSGTSKAGFPQTMTARHSLFYTKELQSNANNNCLDAAWRININDVYNPLQPVSGSSQPSFFDEMATIYARHKTTYCRLVVTFTPLGLNGTTGGNDHVILVHAGASNDGWNSIGAATGNPGNLNDSRNRALAPNSYLYQRPMQSISQTNTHDATNSQLSSPFSKVFSYRISNFFKDYDFGDEKFSGSTASSPAELVSFWVSGQCNVAAAGTVAGADWRYRVTIKATFTTTWYEPIASAWSMDSVA